MRQLRRAINVWREELDPIPWNYDSVCLMTSTDIFCSLIWLEMSGQLSESNATKYAHVPKGITKAENSSCYVEQIRVFGSVKWIYALVRQSPFNDRVLPWSKNNIKLLVYSLNFKNAPKNIKSLLFIILTTLHNWWQWIKTWNKILSPMVGIRNSN